MGKNSFVLVAGSEDQECELWVAKELLMLRIRMRWSGEIQKYVFLWCMKLKRSIATADKSRGSVDLRWSTDDYVYYRLTHRSYVLREGN